MTYREMIDNVIRYADKKAIERFTLLGHSMGGKTSMALASLYPERIDGVIIVEAPPKLKKSEQGLDTQVYGLVFFM